MSESNDDALPPLESWGSIGEQRWRELAEAAGASELQLRFTVLRFSGASASKAARLAGYAGDEKAIRRAGYSAVRSSAVQALLELAEVAAPEDMRITDKEIDAKIAKLIRSADPNVVLKATEIHAKRQAVRREIEAAGDPNDADPHGLIAIDWVFGLFRFEFDLLRQHPAMEWDDCFRAIMSETDKTPHLGRGNGAAKPDGADATL